MSSDIILKKMPTTKEALALTIQNDIRTRKLLELLGKMPPIRSFAVVVQNINEGRPAKETIPDLVPIPDYPREKALQNLDDILQAANQYDFTNLEELLDEGLTLIQNRDGEDHDEQDENRIQEIVEIFNKKGKIAERNLKRRPAFRAKYDAFFNNLGGWVLRFEEVPENKEEFAKNLENFANFTAKSEEVDGETVQIPLGSVRKDTIFTSLENATEFISLLRENTELKELYYATMKQYKPILEGFKATGGVKKPKTDFSKDKMKIKEMYAFGKRYTPAEITTITQVNQYLDVVEQIPGKIGKLIPQKMKNNKYLPISMFLRPESANRVKNKTESKDITGIGSLLLNPYANVLLTQGIQGSQRWFSSFFQGVKITKGKGSQIAKRLIYDDIADLVLRGKKSEFGFEAEDFRDLELTKASYMSQIDAFLADNKSLRRNINNQIKSYRETSLKGLQDVLLRQEKEKLEEGWKKLGEEYGEDFAEDYGDLLFEPVKATKTTPAGFKILYADPDEDGYKEISPVDLVGFLSEIGEGDQSKYLIGEISNIRRFLGQEISFENFLLSLDSNELESIVTEQDSDIAKYTAKLDPIHSLKFLTKMNERMEGDDQHDYIAQTILSMAKEEDMGRKRDMALELKKEIPNIISDMQDLMYSAFTIKLEEFSKNYVNFFPKKPSATIKAIELFTEVGLLSEG
jgi:hypothetical protein